MVVPHEWTHATVTGPEPDRAEFPLPITAKLDPVKPWSAQTWLALSPEAGARRRHGGGEGGCGGDDGNGGGSVR